MQNLNKFYINGEWVKPASNTEFPVLNPATEQQIGVITLGNEDDVNRAVAAAKAAFETYSRTTKEERLALLEKLLEVTKARMEELAQAMTAEMGAPISMSRSPQADSGVEHLQDFIKALKSLDDRETLPNGDTLVREPIGVCGLITPWNWPINQVVLKVVPALATGCTCVLKPSEHTPVSAMLYAEIIHEAGFPAGVFNLIQGEGPTVGAALSRHPDVLMMSFTGSVRAGTAVSKDAADTIKRVTLELGGKSPNIFFADVMAEDDDFFDKALEGFTMFALNQGEVCTCPSRALVQKSIYDRFMEKAIARVEKIKQDNPLKADTMMGAQASNDQLEKVLSYIDIGQKEGAKLLTGGSRLELEGELAEGYYVKPTVFEGHNKMRIFQEEIFGPVLSVAKFKTEDEALEMANDTLYGLGAGVWSRDGNTAYRMGRGIKAGRVWTNCFHLYPAHAAFGGYKPSGVGRENHKMMLDHYQQTKNILVSYSPNALGFF